MTDRLTGKIALVTGASRGIGRAIALRLADEGARVIVHHAASEEPEFGEQTVRSITHSGGRAIAIPADFETQQGVGTLLSGTRAVLREWERAELDVVVNNAAMLARTPTHEVTPELFDRLFAVNVKAPFFLIQQATELLARGGRVVNISSGLTRTAEPGAQPQELVHAMSKGALDVLTLQFARSLGQRDVTINTIGPGVVDNGDRALTVPGVRQALAGLSVFNRIGDPADIADIVAFLAAPDSRWITGSWIDATGGALL